MARYRKKPVVIEAMRVPVDGDVDAWGVLAGWIIVAGGTDSIHLVGPDDGYGVDGLTIDTLEGQMLAKGGDWVIRGVKGEFYAVRNDVFEATYEPEGGGR